MLFKDVPREKPRIKFKSTNIHYKLQYEVFCKSKQKGHVFGLNIFVVKKPLFTATPFVIDITPYVIDLTHFAIYLTHFAI